MINVIQEQQKKDEQETKRKLRKLYPYYRNEYLASPLVVGFREWLRIEKGVYI